MRLPDELLKEAKRVAAERGTTLTALLEDALRAELAGKPTEEGARPVRLTTSGSGWLQPGVDLDDSAALLDLMEGIGDPG